MRLVYVYHILGVFLVSVCLSADGFGGSNYRGQTTFPRLPVPGATVITKHVRKELRIITDAQIVYSLADVCKARILRLGSSVQVRAQSAGDARATSLPSFEVASVRPNRSGTARRFFQFADPSRMTIPNMPVKDPLECAYYPQPFQVSGWPDWINSHVCNIQAKEDDSVVSLPSFEVASIKVDRSEGGHNSIGFRPGRFSTIGASAKSLIEYAYSLASDARLSGGPSWINSEKYVIEAKIDDSLAAKLQKLPPRKRADQVRLMIRSPLADRFKLKVSHVTRQLPIYALVVAKGGAKLAPAANDTGQTAGISSSLHGLTGDLVAKDVSINFFLATLAGQTELEGRIVVDETELKGRYDFKLHWTHEDLEPGRNDANGGAAMANAPLAGPSGPSLFTAHHEQLGLKLESRKEPVEIVVIDHIERPSGN